MMSDNGSTFVAAAKTIQQLTQSSRIQEDLLIHGTTWKFIPTCAPWFGGFWERMIGLSKNAIKKVLGQAYVCLDTLNTIVTEVEAIINDRPLTYVLSDEKDPELIFFTDEDTTIYHIQMKRY
jgi:hypothetical protein